MTATSRRALLGALAAAPALAAPLAIAHAAPTAVAVSPELERLLAIARAARAASNRYEQEIFEPARQRYEAAESRFPHIEVHNPDGGRSYSTADLWEVRRARRATTERVVFHGPGAEEGRQRYKAMRALVMSADLRNAEMSAMKAQMGFQAIEDENERLDEVFYDAVSALDDYRPATFADLQAKLAFMIELDRIETDGPTGVVIADLQRLIGTA